MDTISLLTYYLKLIWAYGSYYMWNLYNLFRDYPFEVRLSAFLTCLWLIMIIVVICEIGRQTLIKERRKNTRKNIYKKYGEGIKRILWDSDISDDLSQSEMISIMGLDQRQVIGKRLLNNFLEKQVFCRMVYDLIIHDYM